MDQRIELELPTPDGPIQTHDKSKIKTTDESQTSLFETAVGGGGCGVNAWRLFTHEARRLCHISLPAIAVQLSVRLVFPQTASCVGRVLGTPELAAFSLASLTANLTCLSILMGALTAAETLMPRAYGAKRYVDVGHLAIQAFAVCSVLLLVPVILLCNSMEWVFDKLGQDDQASKLASQWIRLYVLVVPFMLLFRVVQAFLNAQHVVLPLVVASAVATFVVLPLLLKSRVVPSLGLDGSAICIVLTQFIMVLLVFFYLYIRPEYNPQTWPGLYREGFVKDALRPGPLCNFCKLGFGGVLSLSEWWFWETICILVGSFGVVPLAVHSIAYNVIPTVFMISVGLATGCTVRIGQELEHNVKRAKQIAAWCMACAIFIGALGCDAIWGRVCVFVFVLYIFSINRAIMRALGMQWHIAAVVVACIWCGALPAIIFKAVYLKEGLDAVWTILPAFYSIMQALLILSYARVDWRRVGAGTRDELNDTHDVRREIEMEALSHVE